MPCGVAASNRMRGLRSPTYAFLLSIATNSSAPTGVHRRCGPLRPKPPAGEAAGFELISLKNFRSDNISAQTWVVAGSMKPPNISLVMGCPVRVASMATDTGWAADVPARIATSIDTAYDCLLPCILDLPKRSELERFGVPA